MSRDVSSISLSDRPLTRRTLLRGSGLGLLATGLAACGFRPLYGPQASGVAPGSAVGKELAAIRVGNLPDRNGQLLRRGLQQRLEIYGAGVEARYLLQVSYNLLGEAQGYWRDGSPSRVRYTASGDWHLVTMTTPSTELAKGVEKAFDAYNIPDNQFFAADSSREAMERRLIEMLADEIVQRMALRLQARAAAATPG